MKVKKYYIEYQNWKTEKQWSKEQMTIIDRTKAEELWTNQYCSVYALYAAPDNVRPMTDDEINAKKAKEKEYRKKAAAERKVKKEREKRIVEYASKLREEWHTVWQWLSEHRREVNNGAYCKTGKTLNELIGRNCYVFGSDYSYFNIKDTHYIEDDEEYRRLVQESNERYFDY